MYLLEKGPIIASYQNASIINAWACHKVISTCQNNPARKSARKEKERKTEKDMGVQHHRIDRKVLNDNLTRSEDRERWCELVTVTMMPLRSPKLRVM